MSHDNKSDEKSCNNPDFCLSDWCSCHTPRSKSQLKRLAVQEASHLSGIPLDHEPEKPTS